MYINVCTLLFSRHKQISFSRHSAQCLEQIIVAIQINLQLCQHNQSNNIHYDNLYTGWKKTFENRLTLTFKLASLRISYTKTFFAHIILLTFYESNTKLKTHSSLPCYTFALCDAASRIPHRCIPSYFLSRSIKLPKKLTRTLHLKLTWCTQGRCRSKYTKTL